MMAAQAHTMPQPLAPLLAGLADGVPDALQVSGVDIDSRRVPQGGLFLACRGHDAHGLQYLDQAMARGAAAVAWEPADGVSAPAVDVPTWPVPALRERVGEVAARFYGHPSRELLCVGITGTDGKTSTAYLLAHALTGAGRSAGYMGTLGFGTVDAMELPTHTTPDPVRIQQWLRRLVDRKAQAVVMEVSSHALDQGRAVGVEFDIGILTNIGRDHLDYHGDLDRYAAAKRRLFDWPNLGLQVFNRDDRYGADWSAAAPDAAVYGIEGETPTGGRFAIARNVRLTTRGLGFTLHMPAGQVAVDSGLFGRFNIYNLLATAIVMAHLGEPLDAISVALGRLGTVPGRMEGFAFSDGRLTVVDYAHTPQALAHALESLRAHCAGRLICVFGCGGDRDRGKRALMGQAASRLADEVIVTDDNPRSEPPIQIVRQILEGVAPKACVNVEHDRAQAIRQAIARAKPGDVVLVAGKGHETEQIIGAERRPFSDRGLVATLVEEHAP